MKIIIKDPPTVGI